MMRVSSFLLVLLFYSVSNATTYYISPTGSNGANGITDATPWATFAYADTQLTAGDTLTILDGTYDEVLEPTVSGTEGNPITYIAENRGSAIIQRSTKGRGLYVYSSPTDIKAYLTFDGLSFRSYGEQAAIDIDSQDLSTEVQMTHDIILKNCSAFGSANQLNVMAWKVSRVVDLLIEDSWSYGFGRKSIQLYGCIRATVRRFVARYDYWDGGDYKPNDPRHGFAVYNSKDGIYENVLVIDNAPDPVGRDAAAKAGFAIEGNISDTSAFIGATGNKFLGCLALDNHKNGLYNGGIYDSGEGANDNNTIENFISWSNTDNGIVIQQYSSSVSYNDITSGYNGTTGLRMNSDTVAHNDLIRFVSANNGTSGLITSSTTTITDTTKINNADGDLEVAYAPTYTYLIDPTKIIGHERGATIVNRYVDGVQTSTPLWPWPNEELIHKQMCNSSDLATTNRIAANGDGWEPAWCGSGKTLTQYIWEYLGNACPPNICLQTPLILEIKINL